MTRGRIFHVDVAKDKLLMYSKEYLKYLKEAFEEKDLNPAQAALYLANARNAESAKKTKKKATFKTFNLKDEVNAALETLLKSETDKDVEALQKIAVAQGFNKKLGKANVASETNDRYQIFFIYMGDLLNTLMDLGYLRDKMDEDKFGVIVGNFSYIDLFSAETICQITHSQQRRLLSILLMYQ